MTKATLDWFGCTTYRLKTEGLTIFLDAYIDRIAGADGPPPRHGSPFYGSLVDFISAEVKALQCGRLIPTHHDNYIPGFATQANLPRLKAGILAKCPDVEFVYPDYKPEFVLFP